MGRPPWPLVLPSSCPRAGMEYCCAFRKLLVKTSSIASSFALYGRLPWNSSRLPSEHTQVGSSKSQALCPLQCARHNLEALSAVQQQDVQDRGLCSLSCPCSSLHRTRCGGSGSRALPVPGLGVCAASAPAETRVK